MKKEEWIQYLLKVDDAVNAESPQGFSRRKAQKRFFSLITKLSVEFNIQLPIESGKSIQDASFHSAAFLPKEWQLTPNHILQLRASNFGNLLAVVDDDQIVKTDVLAVIKHYAQELDYQYVPGQVLWEKYSGKNKAIHGSNSWMYRYFEYL